jgi:DNA repair photolyase
LRYHTDTLKAGISRSKEFEKKRLAQYAVNVGTRCGHECTYCSSPALLRMHKSFANAGEKPFERGYSIIDPDIPERVKADAARIRKRGLVQLCTTVDAWSPEAQEHNLGRKCLEAILFEPGWTVRILTKNAAIQKDFDVIEKYKTRVLLGLSITAVPEKENIISSIEPNASKITERIAVMNEAKKLGFRTYAMFCPLLPGINTDTEDIKQLILLAESWSAEEIFVEAVNARANGLKLTQETLKKANFQYEAAEIKKIRNRKNWNDYVVQLIKNIQHNVKKYSDIGKLRILQYPSELTEASVARINFDSAGIIWL